MSKFVLKASNKVKEEGVFSLFVDAPKYLYKNFTNRINDVEVRLNSDVRNPKKVLYVDANDIEFYLPSSFSGSYRNHYGTVKDGNWDKELLSIKNHPKYLACKERAVERKAWEETGIIDHMANRLEESERDTIEHGCSSREDIANLYKQDRENLYQNLKENGFNENISDVCCRIHIGRNGDLILASGGRHRLFFSKILDIEEIPVRVLWRHEQWQSVREEIRNSDDYDELSENAQAAVDHPDVFGFVPDDW